MKISKKTYDELSHLGSAILNAEGQEINNPKPMLLSTDVKRPPTLQEQIQRVLRSNVSKEAHEQGFETLDESQDFDIEDSFDSKDPDTIYQVLDEEIPVMQPEKEESKLTKKEESEVEPDGSSFDPDAQPKEESSKE